MLGVDCLNLFGIDNVNSYYWVTDVTNQQYAVPNYLTGRQLNARISFGSFRHQIIVIFHIILNI